MRILVVLEHARGDLSATSLSALTFARRLADAEPGSEVVAALLGKDIEATAHLAARFAPVLAAEHEALAHPVADNHAAVLADVMRVRHFDWLAGAASTYAKDVLGRAAGLLGGAMVSDVVGHELRDGDFQFRRPMYAGSLIATVTLSGSPRCATVRPGAYPAATATETEHPVEAWLVDATTLPGRVEYLGVESAPTARPDLAAARVVVSGGRAIKSAEEYEQLVGALADCLGGAAGSTRALVDAGITPNDLQVGQTGKMVAPELYVALGLSGAVQHLAGMKNARVIVAINTDPGAPIFEFSNYGLVADVRDAVPQLLAALRS